MCLLNLCYISHHLQDTRMKYTNWIKYTYGDQHGLLNKARYSSSGVLLSILTTHQRLFDVWQLLGHKWFGIHFKLSTYPENKKGRGKIGVSQVRRTVTSLKAIRYFFIFYANKNIFLHQSYNFTIAVLCACESYEYMTKAECYPHVMLGPFI